VSIDGFKLMKMDEIETNRNFGFSGSGKGYGGFGKGYGKDSYGKDNFGKDNFAKDNFSNNSSGLAMNNDFAKSGFGKNDFGKDSYGKDFGGGKGMDIKGMEGKGMIETGGKEMGKDFGKDFEGKGNDSSSATEPIPYNADPGELEKATSAEGAFIPPARGSKGGMFGGDDGKCGFEEKGFGAKGYDPRGGFDEKGFGGKGFAGKGFDNSGFDGKGTKGFDGKDCLPDAPADAPANGDGQPDGDDGEDNAAAQPGSSLLGNLISRMAMPTGPTSPGGIQTGSGAADENNPASPAGQDNDANTGDTTNNANILSGWGSPETGVRAGSTTPKKSDPASSTSSTKGATAPTTRAMNPATSHTGGKGDLNINGIPAAWSSFKRVERYGTSYYLDEASGKYHFLDQKRGIKYAMSPEDFARRMENLERKFFTQNPLTGSPALNTNMNRNDLSNSFSGSNSNDGTSPAVSPGAAQKAAIAGQVVPVRPEMVRGENTIGGRSAMDSKLSNVSSAGKRNNNFQASKQTASAASSPADAETATGGKGDRHGTAIAGRVNKRIAPVIRNVNSGNGWGESNAWGTQDWIAGNEWGQANGSWGQRVNNTFGTNEWPPAASGSNSKDLKEKKRSRRKSSRRRGGRKSERRRRGGRGGRRRRDYTSSSEDSRDFSSSDDSSSFSDSEDSGGFRSSSFDSSVDRRKHRRSKRKDTGRSRHTGKKHTNAEGVSQGAGAADAVAPMGSPTAFATASPTAFAAAGKKVGIVQDLFLCCPSNM